MPKPSRCRRIGEIRRAEPRACCAKKSRETGQELEVKKGKEHIECLGKQY